MRKTMRIALPLGPLCPGLAFGLLAASPALAADTTKLLQQFAADNRKDAGFVRFEALRDVAPVNHFAIVEVWQSKQAYDAHLTLPHSKTFRDQLQAGLGSPFDERLYNILQ